MADVNLIGDINTSDGTYVKETGGGSSSVLALTESRVGIGTTSPDYKVHVRENSSNNMATIGLQSDTPALALQVRGSSQAGIFGAGNGAVELVSVGNQNMVMGTYSGTGNLLLGTNSTERMRIVAGGNVGIGTTNPGAKLEIKSSSASTVPLVVNTPASPSVDIARFQQNGSTKFVINKDGHVGIGTDPGIAAQQVYGSFNSWMAAFQNTDSSGHGIVITIPSASSSSEVLCVYGASDKALLVTGDGKVHIGSMSGARLSVNGGIQINDDTDSASPGKAGTLRYRTAASIGYLDVCVQTGAYSYSWVNIAHG